MTTYWCEHAVLPGGLRHAVRLGVDGGRIREVLPDEPAQPDDHVLAGVVLPGFANGHSHAFHRALRGRTHDDGGNFWTWREAMYGVTHRLDPDSYHQLATAVFAEMVLAGYTAVGEFHYVHHAAGGRRYDDPNAMARAVLAAAREAGIRITLLDTCYLEGGLTASGHLPLDDVQQRFSDGSVQAWAERVALLADDDTSRIGTAVHSVRAVRREDLADVGRFASDGDRPLHVHLSEQPGENLACESFHGCTPTALLAGEGLLTPSTTVVHATHLSDDDIALLAAARSTACFCPTTERDLADGIGPARRLHDSGVPLSLGSDQHAVIDPFEEARGVEMHERLETLERGRFSPSDLLGMATLYGYRSLGWDDGGLIATGHLADLVAVRLDSPRTAGCGADQVLYAATSADVTDVVVGGEPVVTGGRHRVGDVGALLGDTIAAVRR
ncbi:formimidoylglutamate deiminase [Fodinibacter luteus]|uniref:Formimidoylglutamate deiminase n=1 Tax=Fodinibacter luteus TaxID=552064 RepID=A0ABP8K2S1_9MICO